MTAEPTRLTWTPDLGDAAPTHAEWMHVATIAETILDIHIRRAFGGELTVAVRPPTPAPYRGYGLHGLDSLGFWVHLFHRFDVPVPAPTTRSQKRWTRHLGDDAPATLRGILALAQRQALEEVAERRNLPVGVTLTREDWETLQAVVRQARRGGDALPDMAQQIIDPWREALDSARDAEPRRCSTCGSADLQVDAFVTARGQAVLPEEGPTGVVWCERCQEYD